MHKEREMRGSRSWDSATGLVGWCREVRRVATESARSYGLQTAPAALPCLPSQGRVLGNDPAPSVWNLRRALCVDPRATLGI